MNYVPKTNWVSGEILYHTDMNRIESGVAEAFTATKGDKGDIGPQGIEGPVGPTGPQGPVGPQGEAGLKGDQGPQGMQGIQGIKGDTGNGFSISNTYPSVAAMNADYANAGVPIGGFVIIASADADNGRLFVKTESSFVFQAQLAGVKGDKGDTGAQGIQGPAGLQGPIGATGAQGATGPQGERGIQGIAGPAGATGPKGDTGLQGLQGVAGPVGATGPKGDKSDTGPMGIQGLQGIQGPIGPTGPTGPQGPASTYTLPTATASVLGGIRIGTGLSIASGVVSVDQKEYLSAHRNLSQDFTTTGQTVNFNHNILQRGISYSSATSQFSLKQGKIYRITFSTSVNFAAANNFVSFSLFQTDGTRLTEVAALYTNIASTYNEAGNGSFDIVYVPTANITACIRVASISASTTATLRQSYTSFVIQEL